MAHTVLPRDVLPRGESPGRIAEGGGEPAPGRGTLCRYRCKHFALIHK